MGSQKWAIPGSWPTGLAVGDQGGQSRESPQHCWPSGARLGRVSACRGTNRDLGRASQPCLPLSFSLQRESANILISSHTQTPRPDPRIHILGDLHKLPAINRAHEVQGLRASTLAKNTVQEDWKEGKGRGLPRRARSTDVVSRGLEYQCLAVLPGSLSHLLQPLYGLAAVVGT